MPKLLIRAKWMPYREVPAALHGMASAVPFSHPAAHAISLELTQDCQEAAKKGGGRKKRTRVRRQGQSNPNHRFGRTVVRPLSNSSK